MFAKFIEGMEPYVHALNQLAVLLEQLQPVLLLESPAAIESCRERKPIVPLGKPICDQTALTPGQNRRRRLLHQRLPRNHPPMVSNAGQEDPFAVIVVFELENSRVSSKRLQPIQFGCGSGLQMQNFDYRLLFQTSIQNVAIMTGQHQPIRAIQGQPSRCMIQGGVSQFFTQDSTLTPAKFRNSPAIEVLCHSLSARPAFECNVPGKLILTLITIRLVESQVAELFFSGNAP